MKADLVKNYYQIREQYKEISDTLKSILTKTKKLHKKVFREIDKWDNSSELYKNKKYRYKLEELIYVNDYIKDALDCIKCGCKISED